jgi:hypothetical protein
VAGGDASGELVAKGSGDAPVPGVASSAVGVASGDSVAAGAGVAGIVLTGGGGAGGSDLEHASSVVTSISVIVAIPARALPFIRARPLS